MITALQPVGWGRAVFVSVTLLVLSVFAEGMFGVPLDAKHVSLIPALISCLVVVGCVALLLAVCFELAFATRLPSAPRARCAGYRASRSGCRWRSSSGS